MSFCTLPTFSETALGPVYVAELFLSPAVMGAVRKPIRITRDTAEHQVRKLGFNTSGELMTTPSGDIDGLLVPFAKIGVTESSSYRRAQPTPVHRLAPLPLEGTAELP